MKISEVVSQTQKMEAVLASKTVLKSKFVYGIRKKLTAMKAVFDEYRELSKDFQRQVDATPEDKRQEKIVECNKMLEEHAAQEVDIPVYTVAEEFLPEQAEAFILDVAFTMTEEVKKDK